jgi:hypothetical protein
MSTLEIEDNGDAAGLLADTFSSTELRRLASNAAVSRERGDTKAETAERLVEQAPAVAARMCEELHGADADGFREARETGGEHVSLNEAIERARHSKMADRLRDIGRAMLNHPSYHVRVRWEYASKVRDGSSMVGRGSGYEPRLTAVEVRADDDADLNHFVEGRADVYLTPNGRCTQFDVDSGTGRRTYIDRDTRNPSVKWRRATDALAMLYEPED